MSKYFCSISPEKNTVVLDLKKLFPDLVSNVSIKVGNISSGNDEYVNNNIYINSVKCSVLGNEIPVVKIGRGSKEVFYSASFHANEWITTPVLMKFLADFCYCYVNNLNIFGYNARTLYNSCTIYIMPMVNPDGIDLIFTGYFLRLF